MILKVNFQKGVTMKVIKYSFLLGLLLTTNACTSITIIPPVGDMQTVIANASTEKEAVGIANNRARRTCTVQNQTIKIIDLDTTYQGIDPAQKTLAKLAENILPKDKTSRSYTPDGYTYKATLTFRCI